MQKMECETERNWVNIHSTIIKELSFADDGDTLDETEEGFQRSIDTLQWSRVNYGL